MSAPDSSNSKAPPSLLADTAKGPQTNAAKGAQATGSRILADLEGRVAPPTDKPRRSTAPAMLVALLVVAAGGWGAWHLQQRAGGGHPVVATSPTPAAAQTAALPAGGSPARVTAKAASTVAASAPQAATIIADDSENKDSKPSDEVGASAAGGVDDNRLSRVLANGAEMSGASAAPAEAGKNVNPAAAASAANHAHHEHETAVASVHAKHETPANRHGSPTTLAQAKKDKQRTTSSGAAPKDDPDADLLAALVARTRPADTKAGANGAATTRVSASANSGDPKLADRVKECGTRGFFEDQLCRWRVCDGHWGKDPACPGSATPAKQQ